MLYNRTWQTGWTHLKPIKRELNIYRLMQDRLVLHKEPRIKPSLKPIKQIDASHPTRPDCIFHPKCWFISCSSSRCELYSNKCTLLLNSGHVKKEMRNPHRFVMVIQTEWLRLEIWDGHKSVRVGLHPGGSGCVSTASSLSATLFASY